LTDASPAIQAKITCAGTACRSFGQGSDALQKLADLPIAEKQVERVSECIGAERVAERQAEVAAYQDLPLASKFAVPDGVTAPDLAVVMTDGGRLQILDRGAAQDPPAAAGPVAGPPAGPPRSRTAPPRRPRPRCGSRTRAAAQRVIGGKTRWVCC
jgi:hypothetical protein